MTIRLRSLNEPYRETPEDMRDEMKGPIDGMTEGVNETEYCLASCETCPRRVTEWYLGRGDTA